MAEEMKILYAGSNCPPGNLFPTYHNFREIERRQVTEKEGEAVSSFADLDIFLPSNGEDNV